MRLNKESYEYYKDYLPKEIDKWESLKNNAFASYIEKTKEYVAYLEEQGYFNSFIEEKIAHAKEEYETASKFLWEMKEKRALIETLIKED